MPIDLFAVQDTITDYLGTAFPQYEIIEDGIPDDTEMPMANGKIVNFIALNWGSLVRKPGGSSMQGARWDDYYSTVDVFVAGPVGRHTRQSLSIIVDRLTGYRPTGGNEMAPRGNTTTFVIRDNNGNKSGYAASQRFFFGVNGEAVGEHITPPGP